MMTVVCLLMPLLVFAMGGNAEGLPLQFVKASKSTLIGEAGRKRQVSRLQHRYAEQLFQTGDYQAARLEYKRLLFEQPDTELKDLADYRIAQSYYYQDKGELAQLLFKEFAAIHPRSPFRFQSQLMLGQLYFDAGAYSIARTTLFELLHMSDDAAVAAMAHYLRGWCYIHTTDWNKAIAELRRVDVPEADAILMEKAQRVAGTLLAETPLSVKSPQMAAWLSTFVPGSGQFYVGNLKEGLIATAVSGTFIYLAADAIRERRYVDCVGISLVGWRFYWGNRTEARRLASEYNRHREQELIQTLKHQAASVRQ